MRGVLRFGGFPGVRHVPRQSGGCWSSRSLSVPGFYGRCWRRDGLGGTVAGDGTRRRLGIAVSRLVMNCHAAGRVTPPQQLGASRPAARAFQAPPKGATCGVQPHRISGAAKRPCRRSADNIPGAPSRGAGKAAASSRDAFRVRRASVVTTAKLAKLGSDDALRQHRHVEEPPYLRGFSRIGFGQSKSAGKCRRAKERFFDPGSKPFYPSVSASWQQDRTEALSGKDLSFRASRPERIKAA